MQIHREREEAVHGDVSYNLARASALAHWLGWVLGTLGMIQRHTAAGSGTRGAKHGSGGGSGDAFMGMKRLFESGMRWIAPTKGNAKALPAPPGGTERTPPPAGNGGRDGRGGGGGSGRGRERDGVASPAASASSGSPSPHGATLMLPTRVHVLSFKQKLQVLLFEICGEILNAMKAEVKPMLHRMSKLRPALLVQQGVEPYIDLVASLDALLAHIVRARVPEPYVHMLMNCTMSFVDRELFNDIMMRSEMCSFAAGKRVIEGLNYVVAWMAKKGLSQDDLKHVWQATHFMITNKAHLAVNDIKGDLLRDLSGTQIFRLCLQFSDEEYGTSGVPHAVMMHFKQEHKMQSKSNLMMLPDAELRLPEAQLMKSRGGKMPDLRAAVTLPPSAMLPATFSFLASALV